MNYAFAHEDRVYGPDGPIVGIAPAQTVEYNRGLESKELDWLKTGPERVFAYVNQSGQDWQVTTWLGTVLDGHAHVGRTYQVPAFGCWPSRRRAVSCRIFGVLYHGTYYESSGNYCRLRKAKRQERTNK